MEAGTITAVDTTEPPPDAPEIAEPSKPYDAAPVFILSFMIGLYIVVFGSLTWRQQSNFGTFGFDMGIYDQGIWLVSRFKEPFVTVRGLNYFGHHVNLITLLFVPFYWLGAGPHFLVLVQTIAMAAGAIPIWLLARDLTDRWTALVPAAAFLLFPSLEWINWWHFHPDALIITPLLFAWWLATRQKWRWFMVAVACALLAKEDAALAIIVMGIVLAIRGEKKWGARTFVAGLVWFLICTRLIIPIANGGKQPFYEELFPGFGHSMVQIVWTMIRHPSRIYRVAVYPDRLKYYRQLFFPLALFPLGAPLLLLIGGPQMVVNVVSAHQPTHDIRFHYSSVLIAVLFIATVETFGRIVRRGDGWRVAAVALLLVSSMLSHREWSPSPVGRQYNSGIWAKAQPKHEVLKQALKLIRPEDKVTATYYIVPHITQRRYAYEFPNPFRVANWGINGEDPPNSKTSDTLILDTTLNGNDASVYETLVGPLGQFKIVFSQDGIIVARRR